MKGFKRFLSPCLALLVCAVAVLGGVTAERDVSGAESGYYAKITAEGGTALLGQVHDLITTTHTRYTSYTDCKNPTYYKLTDPGPNGELMEFYAQEELSSTWKQGATGTWNREHVWCQSLSNGLWGESGGGADLLHIRPTESRVNSARGNNKYAEISGSKSTVIYRDASNTEIGPAGYTGGGKFEPLDQVKGDVARIVLYMYTHYNTYNNVYGTTNGTGRSNFFGTLHFTDIVSASNEEGAIDLLLAWNEADPPDELEAARNEAAEEIQGNRNPFVDHPEYAEAIWGDDAATEELTGLSIGPSTLTMTVGESYTFRVTPTPSGASKEVEWSVSDLQVLSVSGGVVTAEGKGEATVTAVSKVNPSVSASVRITVVGEEDEALAAFKNAVNGIVTEGELQRQFASLLNAIAAYGRLSGDARELVREEIALLYEAIDAYDRKVGAFNADAEQAGNAAFGGASALLGRS